MKQRITLYTFLLSGLIMLFINTDTKASHIMGGDITYNCIAPNTYAFTAQFYRDCNGVTLPPSVSLTIYSPSGCGPSQTITLELVPSGQQIVTPLCPGVPDACNGSGTYGIQQYTYTHVPASQGSGTSSPPVVLNSSCTDWTVWWSSCCRNGTISTGPANDGFYLETLLNNQDAPCNNSPTFLNIPTPYACVGETVNYSHGVSEWDGDSLVFSLIPCLQGNAPTPNSVNYASPYSGTSPLSSSTGFSINPQTGAITFTPNVAQVGVICVMVEEYRNGVKIGHVMRDMQFTVLNCSNSLPLASGVDGTASSAGVTGSYNVQVCEGETIDFMISTFDTLATGQVTGDNINLSWNGGINSPNASFTVFNNGTDSSSARFKWTTTKNDAGFYIFTVNLQDDACPINGVNIFTFTVTVDDVPDVDAGGYQVACNPNDSLVLNAVQNSLDLFYQWTTETGTGTVSDPTILGPQVPPVTGTYKLIKTYQSGCIDSNLVAVDLSPGLQIPTIPDANLCQGDSIQMNATIPVTSNPPSFFSNNTVTPFGQAADTAISVITVTGIQPGVFQADMLQSVCIDVNYPLTSFLSISLVSPSGTVINLSSNNGNGSNFTNTCFEENAATSITAGNNPFTGTYSPEGTFSTFNGDVVNGGWTLWVATSTAIPLPNLQLNSWSMTFVDITDTISYQWTPATDLSCTTCPDPWASPTTPTNYQIIATDFFGCTDTQNVFIDIISALTAPVVTCAQVTTTSLTFAWGAVTGATGYEVSIDNGATWVPANGTLQHQITGLALGQSVTILVRGTSTCPGTPPAGTQTCTTTPCTLDASFVSSSDVSCNAGSDGTLDVSAIGGTPSYSYQIGTQSVQTSPNFTGLSAGNYTATVTDVNGCIDTVQVTINEPSAITFTTDSLLTSCFGSADGVAIVAATGGTGAFSYQWDSNAGSQTTDTATALVAGVYNVTMTDVNSCFTVGTITVTEPPLIVLDSMTIDVSCNAAMDGTAQVLVQGGTGPFTYAWSSNANGQTLDSIVGLNGGTYSVSVTDINGCLDSLSMYVDEASAIVLSTAMTPATCNGFNDGTITVTASGGTPSAAGYSYQWDANANNQTTNTASNIGTGIYFVTVTDGDGCTEVISDTVIAPLGMTLTTVSEDSSTTCSYNNDGTAVVTPMGGNGGYSYSWSQGTNPTDSAITGLPAGVSYVTVTDILGCSEVDSIIITSPTPIVINPTPVAISCNGADDGSITLAPVGGTGAYTFNWSNNDTTQDISGLTAGTYFVTVTDDNDCSFIDSATIIEPDTLQTLASMTAVSCFGGNDGTASALPSGVQLPFSYAWSNGSSDSTATGLTAGTYSLTVTDAAGCTDSATVIVTEPSTAVSSTTSGTDLLCNGDGSGTVTVIGTGGTPDPSIASGYTYQWSDANAQTAATATGLQAGTYYVTVTDLNGCSTVDSVTINEPTALTGVTSGTPASCFGSLDGTVSVTPSGGTSPYTYQWSAPSNSTDSLVIGLGAGWHYVTVTDANACTYVDSFEVLQPAMIMTTTSVTPVGCFGDSTGTAGVTVTGGNGGETFIWSFGNITTQNITGLPAGWHYVTVTDINGCSTVDSVEVIEPTPIALSTTQVNVGCFGAATGTATVISTGGTPGYTYLWSSTPQQTSATATNLTAGTYTVTVTDLNGCSDTISVTITQPATAVSITDISFTQVSCNGGSDGTATVTATGGAGNYTYNWSSGQTTQTTSGLPIGTYTVTVTDANGCSTTGSITIDEPAPITTIFTNVSGSSCNSGSDGTATIAASGGVPNGANGYTYIWNTVPAQNGATATGLNGGQTYSVVVTDANGCTTIDSVYIPQPDPVTLSTTQVNVSCYSFDDAEATVIPVGGTPGYTFLWDVNAGNQTTGTATGLTAGSYSVVVTDANGCTAATGVTITQPAELVTNKTTVDVLCKGESTGEAEVLMSGGTGPYFINWEGGLSNPPTDLAAGTYSYVVTDANGCQLTDSVTIEEPQNGVSALFESVDVTCYDDRDGIINIYPNGGVGPYQFSLDGVSFDDNHSKIGLQGGDYTYYVRDDNGCIYSETVTIGEPDEFTVDLGPDVDIIMGESVQLEVTPSNGTPNYTYTWTPAENLSCIDCGNPTVDSLQDDRYITVLVEDSNGCTAEDDIYIRMEKPRYVFIANAFTPNGDGNNDWLFVQGGIGTERVVSFQVFDRWGEIVYEVTDVPLNDSASGWDGTYKGQEMNGGVFVWVAEVEFGDGERLVYKGSTVLIR